MLDFNNGALNRGKDALVAIAQSKGFLVDVFDVRKKELPDIDAYDDFQGTGGPGNPNLWGQYPTNEDGTPNVIGDWGQGVFDLFNGIVAHNKENPDRPKHLFTMCHSFQMLCLSQNLGKLTKRDETLLGIHEQIKRPYAEFAPHAFFSDAPDIIDSFESRDWQVKPVYCTDGSGDFLPIFEDKNKALTGVCTWDGHIAGVQCHFEASPQTVAEMATDKTQERNVKFQETVVAVCGEEELENIAKRAPNLHVGYDMINAFWEAAYQGKSALRLTA